MCQSNSPLTNSLSFHVHFLTYPKILHLPISWPLSCPKSTLFGHIFMYEQPFLAKMKLPQQTSAVASSLTRGGEILAAENFNRLSFLQVFGGNNVAMRSCVKQRCYIWSLAFQSILPHLPAQR